MGLSAGGSRLMTPSLISVPETPPSGSEGAAGWSKRWEVREREQKFDDVKAEGRKRKCV